MLLQAESECLFVVSELFVCRDVKLLLGSNFSRQTRNEFFNKQEERVVNTI